MWFGQTIVFTPSKAHPKHLSLHPLSRWLVHSLIPRCIHQVQKQELAWQTGMQLSSQNKYRTICYQSAFPPTDSLALSMQAHTRRHTKTERNPQGVPSHCAILTLLTYCSTRRKEQQWRRIWTRKKSGMGTKGKLLHRFHSCSSNWGTHKTCTAVHTNASWFFNRTTCAASLGLCLFKIMKNNHKYFRSFVFLANPSPRKYPWMYASFS